MKEILAALLAAASLALDPAATLRPDAFDAPAETAVAEASKGTGEQRGGGLQPAAERSEARPHVHGAHETHEEAAAVTYVCPMHPEYTSKEPGKCPKCGMTLVVKKP
ncbi:MAG: hypothetical protein JOZ54_02670 [Acidobacteria bacterium]|nr:hypothetical protein [Acidobacteriota bacterium]